MSTLQVQLFGKFNVQRGTQLVKGLDASKEQELLSYLLLSRERCHPRETLANLLWSDTSTERSKKYLRQALWHLQTALDGGDSCAQPILNVEHDWVQLNLRRELSLDVATFERAVAASQSLAGSDLDAAHAQLLREAVELYRGDLLDGWYQDWCLFERERLQNLYLMSLDKLMGYCQARGEYEVGFDYGVRILRYDRAHERTHRRLMYLRLMAGDRTGALRQYERCVTALREELEVKPERRTTALYESIKAGSATDEQSLHVKQVPTSPTSPPEALRKLKRLQMLLTSVHNRIQRDIRDLEHGLKTMKQ